jgi:uroporphyrinogen decarboxylase
MNSLERIQAAVAFEVTDRVPVLPQLFGHAAVIAGETIHDYGRSGDLLARCQLKALERYGHDAVFAVADTSVETEAAGSELAYRTNDYPYVQTHAFSKSTNLTAVAIPDPSRAGRMPEILHALTILRRELKDEVLVVGCVLGPMTMAGQLLGLETALYLAIDDPAGFQRLLDFSTEVVIRFGVAQIEAGAHLPMVFDPAASPDVIPPALFRELEGPRIKRLFEAFHAAGAHANWLHIAGPTTPILPFCLDTGADILNFDYCVDPSAIMDKAPSACCNGNIKCLDFEEATPQSILSQSMKLMDQFRHRGGFILSSGCEIPPGARPENVEALVSATREWR